MIIEALKAVKQAFLNDPRWDNTEIGVMVNQAIAEAEQDSQCKHCKNGCVACDARLAETEKK